MTGWFVLGSVAWLVFATAVGIVVGKSIAGPDVHKRRAIEAAQGRHPSGRALRSVS